MKKKFKKVIMAELNKDIAVKPTAADKVNLFTFVLCVIRRDGAK